MLNLVKDRKFLSFKEVFKVYYAKPGQRPEVSFCLVAVRCSVQCLPC